MKPEEEIVVHQSVSLTSPDDRLPGNDSQLVYNKENRADGSRYSDENKKKMPLAATFPKWVSRVVIAWICLLALTSTMGGLVLEGFLVMMFHLATGWIGFLWNAWSNARPDLLLLASFLVGLGVAAVCLHAVMRQVMRQRFGNTRGWRWKWTLSLVAMPIVLFAVCVSIQGAVTVSGWLGSEPLDEGHNRGMRKIYAGRLARFGKFVAEEENQNHLPGSLFSISAYIEEPLERGRRLYVYNPEIHDVPEYWTWLGGVRLDSPGDTPVAFAPRALRKGDRVVSFLDGTARECTEEEWQAALERWRQAMAKSRDNGATPEAK